MSTRHSRRITGIGVIIGLCVATIAAPASALPSEPDVGPLAGGTEVTIELPEAPIGPDFTSISAGNTTSFGLGTDGNLYAWGSNSAGASGTGESKGFTAPKRTLMPVGAEITHYSAGVYNGYAVTADGEAYSWGAGFGGALGSGPSPLPRRAPGLVQRPDDVYFSSVYGGRQYAIALDNAGKAYAWGVNSGAELGIGETGASKTVPTAVDMPAGVSFVDISTRFDHTLAIGDDGNTYVWGTNETGLLGKAGPTVVNKPTLVGMPRGVTSYVQVATGWYFLAGLGDNGRVYTWGQNYKGALGNGSSQNSSTTPVEVALPAGITVQQIALGADHALALTTEGELYAWGTNEYGEIGNGEVDPAGVYRPVLVQSPEDVKFTSVTAGQKFSAALGDDGVTYSWGLNKDGQLGDGTDESTSLPTPVLLPLVTVEATNVLFGGVPAAALTDNGDGTVTATTPPGAAYGTVDVELQWAANTVPQSPVTLSDRFTYVDAPSVTELENAAANIGDTVTFETTVGGSPKPEVTWQFSTDDGATWRNLVSTETEQVSDDSGRLTVTVTPENAAQLYRVTATNAYGEASSPAVAITVNEFTVAFDAGDGAPIEPITVQGGTSLGEAPQTELKGFTFVGWGLERDNDDLYDFTLSVTADFTLFAKWKKDDTPVEPVDPVDPVDPTKPVDPPKPVKPTAHEDLEATGGDGAMAVWIGAGALLVVGAGALLIGRKKKSDPNE